jgi:hypothetical protein
VTDDLFKVLDAERQPDPLVEGRRVEPPPTELVVSEVVKDGEVTDFVRTYRFLRNEEVPYLERRRFAEQLAEATSTSLLFQSFGRFEDIERPEWHMCTCLSRKMAECGLVAISVDDVLAEMVDAVVVYFGHGVYPNEGRELYSVPTTVSVQSDLDTRVYVKFPERPVELLVKIMDRSRANDLDDDVVGKRIEHHVRTLVEGLDAGAVALDTSDVNVPHVSWDIASRCLDL